MRVRRDENFEEKVDLLLRHCFIWLGITSWDLVRVLCFVLVFFSLVGCFYLLPLQCSFCTVCSSWNRFIFASGSFLCIILSIRLDMHVRKLAVSSLALRCLFVLQCALCLLHACVSRWRDLAFLDVHWLMLAFILWSCCPFMQALRLQTSHRYRLSLRTSRELVASSIGLRVNALVFAVKRHARCDEWKYTKRPLLSSVDQLSRLSANEWFQGLWLARFGLELGCDHLVMIVTRVPTLIFTLGWTWVIGLSFTFCFCCRWHIHC